MLDFSLMLSSIMRLLGGLVLTLELFASILMVGIVIGVPVALAHASKSRFTHAVAAGYILVFRGTPSLVQLFLVYYGLGQFEAVRTSALWPLLREPFWCTVAALGLNSGAYTGRLISGALTAVPHGVVEAAQALALRPSAIFFRVKAPLAVQLALPAYSNEVILTLKATSLASTVTLMELTGTARLIVSETYAPYEIFLTAGLIYLGMTLIITRVFRWLERAVARRLGAVDRWSHFARAAAS
jgi:polar amino acid transport system permease protein/octopine/nopaline transport system permease protein